MSVTEEIKALIAAKDTEELPALWQSGFRSGLWKALEFIHKDAENLSEFGILAICAIRYTLDHLSCKDYDVVATLLNNIDKIKQPLLSILIEDIQGYLKKDNVGLDADKSELVKLLAVLEDNLQRILHGKMSAM